MEIIENFKVLNATPYKKARNWNKLGTDKTFDGCEHDLKRLFAYFMELKRTVHMKMFVFYKKEYRNMV